MNANELLVSNKYARAYLNVFFDDLTEKDILAIQKTYEYLEEDKQVIFFLRFPVVGPEVKLQALTIIAQQEKLPKSMLTLMKLLLKHKQLELLQEVLASIVRQYREQKGIMTFLISSSPALTTQELHSLVEFLARVTGRSIIYDYTVDPHLIAGIRLQSTTLLWEQSVRKQLHAIASLAQQ